MEMVGGLFVGVGVVLTLLAAVGVLRLPDVLIRMNAATKAAGLGVSCVLVGVGFLKPGVSVTVKVVIAVLLQFVTTPIAGHVVGRAAYRAGTPLWEGTRYDELAGSELLARTTDPADAPRG